MIKILATSDLHGNLPIISEPFDLLLIAGDICPAHDHYYSFQYEWVMNEFVEWINSLPFKNENSLVIMTWGNHDFVGERWTENDNYEFHKKTKYQVNILRHDIFEYITEYGTVLKIFGTPYCSMFGNWAFMIDDEKLEKKFSQIPDDIDILISHDSPNINKLGAITEGKWKNDETGNSILAKHIKRIKPKLFVSGHFHSGNHIPEAIDGTLMANVSYVNEKYIPSHPIFSINYDEKNNSYISEI